MTRELHFPFLFIFFFRLLRISYRSQKHTHSPTHTHTHNHTLTHTHTYTESNQTRSRASFLHVVALRYSGERTKMTSLRRQGVAERARSSGWRTSLGIVLASNSCTFPATRTAVYVLWTLMRTILSQEMESGFWPLAEKQKVSSGIHFFGNSVLFMAFRKLCAYRMCSVRYRWQ